LDGTYIALGEGGGGGLASTDIDTSAELDAIVTDDVGSGALMFGVDEAMSDDINCPAGGVLIRDGSDAAFTCSTAAAETFNYDPDLPPASFGTGGWGEEWKGNAASQAWAWGNQGTATESIALDSAFLTSPTTGAATDNIRARCVAAPASGDYVLHAKLSCTGNLTFNQCGIAFLRGTLATPTQIRTQMLVWDGDTNVNFYSQQFTNYTTFSSQTTPSRLGFSDGDMNTRTTYLRLAFTDSGDVVVPSASHDGALYWITSTVSSVTMAGNPDFICYLGNSVDNVEGSIGRYDWIRLRTDSGKAYPSDPTPTKLVVGGTTTRSDYDPDEAPTPCYACESWNDGTSALSWSWQNQGGATETLSMDSSVLNAPAGAGTSLRLRHAASAIPSSGNFAVVTKVNVMGRSQFNQCGLWVLTGGTPASPTQHYALLNYVSGSGFRYAVNRYTTNYTGAGITSLSDYDTSVFYPFMNTSVYMLMNWTDSSNNIDFYTSQDGMAWNFMVSATAGANISDAGIVCNSETASSNAYGVFEWFRVLSDSSQLTVPFKVGADKSSISITGVQADTGANGSIESYGTTKITTTQDDHGAGSVASNVLDLNFRKIPPHDNYDPMRPPSTCATCDEFYDNTASLTFSCNGGSITQTIEKDRYRMVKAMSGSSANIGACTVAAPSGSWTATTRISQFLPVSFAQCGLIAIRTGTQATPTAISACLQYQNGSGDRFPTVRDFIFILLDA
jgi:hypothetical protein